MTRVSSLIVTAVVFVGSTSAFASTYVTGKNQTFVSVQDPDFGSTWQAPDGSVWSQYQGLATNTGQPGAPIAGSGWRDEDPQMLNSEAVQRCSKLNAKLPTVAQYAHLFDYFSDAGDVLKLFPLPPGARSMIWTRNTFDNASFARFVKMTDTFGDLAPGMSRFSVFCVH